MKSKASKHGRPALDLVEEAVQELRRTPARLWLAYYAGAIPFVLGLLYFWADMRYGARAGRHCAELALGVTLLFVWMKGCQTVFVAGLRERLAGRAPAPWTARRAGRVLLVQAAVQPTQLLLLPLAAVSLLLFPWTLAFYESVTALGDGGRPAALRELRRQAARQAGAWPGQNVLLVLILILLGAVLWLNAMVAMLCLPYLLKQFLGWDTAFTQGGAHSFLNTTFLGTSVALAALALDPLVKMIYTLRGFHSDARRDGADLLAELAWVRRGAAALMAALAWLAVSLPPAAVAAAPAPAAAVAPATSATPAQLDQAFQTTLAGDKYTWRLPREKVADAPDGWFMAALQGVGETLDRWTEAVREWIGHAMDWFDQLFKPQKPADDTALKPGRDWMSALRGMAVVLLILAVGALGWLLWRYGRLAWKKQELVKAEVLPAQPDLLDENVTASQLPEDEWLKLARELAGRGDWRPALRALYLATLAHLAARELVSLARFKSNRDYQLEVARRARGNPDLRRAFEENVARFDCVWYGRYAVSGEGYGQFLANVERIRSC